MLSSATLPSSSVSRILNCLFAFLLCSPHSLFPFSTFILFPFFFFNERELFHCAVLFVCLFALNTFILHALNRTVYYDFLSSFREDDAQPRRNNMRLLRAISLALSLLLKRSRPRCIHSYNTQYYAIRATFYVALITCIVFVFHLLSSFHGEWLLFGPLLSSIHMAFTPIESMPIWKTRSTNTFTHRNFLYSFDFESAG